jgi:hypothetical protein
MTLGAFTVVFGYLMGMVGFLAVVGFIAYVGTEILILAAKGKIRRKRR